MSLPEFPDAEVEEARAVAVCAISHWFSKDFSFIDRMPEGSDHRRVAEFVREHHSAIVEHFSAILVDIVTSAVIDYTVTLVRMYPEKFVDPECTDDDCAIHGKNGYIAQVLAEEDADKVDPRITGGYH